MDEEQITIKYKNWRGEIAIRHILPKKIWFGSTEWHKEKQWFLQAEDIDRGESRDFALKDILGILSEN